MISVGKKKGSGSSLLNLAFTSDSYKIIAEAGDFAAHEALGWERNDDRVDLAEYGGVPVIDFNGGGVNTTDGSTGSESLKNISLRIPLVLEDFNNMHRYGGVYSGHVSLDSINGSLGFFTGFGTNIANQITGLDGTKPFNSNSRRIGAFIRHNADGHVYSLGGFNTGSANIVMNGIDTVDVVNWAGDTITNTLPEIKKGEFFTFEFHIRDGFDKTMFLYMNGILVNNPVFTSHALDNEVAMHAGSASTYRHSYIKEFGANINTNESNLILTKNQLEASSGVNLSIPKGTRSYSVELPKGMQLPSGHIFNVKSQTIGELTWSPSDGDGISATIEGYSSGKAELYGLQELTKTNILKDGAQYIGSTVEKWIVDPITGEISYGDIVIKDSKVALGEAEIEYSNITHYAIYGSGQTGLDDLTISGTYDVQDENTLFQIKIDSIDGSFDTFEWKDYADGIWHPGIFITGAVQQLRNGITITFANDTGHTLGDSWYFDAGHEIHISRTMHVMGDMLIHRNLIIAGLIQTFSPLKIQDGIKISCDKTTDRGIINTTCTALDLKIDGKTVLPIEKGMTFASNEIAEIKYFGLRTNNFSGWRLCDGSFM